MKPAQFYLNYQSQDLFDAELARVQGIKRNMNLAKVYTNIEGDDTFINTIKSAATLCKTTNQTIRVYERENIHKEDLDDYFYSWCDDGSHIVADVYQSVVSFYGGPTFFQQPLQDVLAARNNQVAVHADDCDCDTCQVI